MSQMLQANATPKIPKRQFPFLDGFRALGILMILGHHMCVGLDLYHLFDRDTPILSWLLFKSWQYLHIDLSPVYLLIKHMINNFKGILGVQLFLIISGFLITRNLLTDVHSWKDVFRFWCRRFLRIYPAYALMVIVSLVVFSWQAQEDPVNIAAVGLRYLMFLQNYFPRNIYLEHAWTLAIFEQFYVFCPILLMVIYRIFQGELQRRRALIIAFVLLMCLGAVTRYMYIVWDKPMLTWPLKAPHPYFTLMYHLGALSLGCLLAVLKPYWKGWPNNKMAGGLLWGIGVTGYFLLFFVIEWGYHWGDWYMNIIGQLSSLALLSAAFFGVSFLTRFAWMQQLGRHSYGIYLWHILIIIFWARWMHTLPPTIVILLTTISSIAAGILSSMTVEKYFLSLREKIKN